MSQDGWNCKAAVEAVTLVCVLRICFVGAVSLQEGLVNVGWMDCSTQSDLCESFEVTTSTTVFFPPGSMLKDKDRILVRTVHRCICTTTTFKRYRGLDKIKKWGPKGGVPLKIMSKCSTADVLLNCFLMPSMVMVTVS